MTRTARKRFSKGEAVVYHYADERYTGGNGRKGTVMREMSGGYPEVWVRWNDGKVSLHNAMHIRRAVAK